MTSQTQADVNEDTSSFRGKTSRIMAAPTTPLSTFGSKKFDFEQMEKFAGAEVTGRFKEALITGENTSAADADALEKAIFAWCTSHGCINYAHW